MKIEVICMAYQHRFSDYSKIETIIEASNFGKP